MTFTAIVDWNNMLNLIFFFILVFKIIRIFVLEMLYLVNEFVRMFVSGKEGKAKYSVGRSLRSGGVKRYFSWI